MKVTYVYHSCFIVELEKSILLFDYYKGELPAFQQDKKIYVFSSHKHHDHFTLEVFHEMEKYKDVTYILSNDIKLNETYLKKNGLNPLLKNKIVNVQANQTYEIEGIIVETLRSTDAGVAFLVQAEGKHLYHAGDLNWWHWSEESEEYNTKMAARYKNEIVRIENRNIDVAFLPVDSRQEDCFWWGVDFFMNKTLTKVAFPMHFWEQYSILDKLKDIANQNGYGDKLYMIEGDGQQWKIQE